MNCPHCKCNSSKCVPEVAFNNTETYGITSHDILCRNCGKPVSVCMTRTVKLIELAKGSHQDDSWGWKKDNPPHRQTVKERGEK